MDHPLLLDQHLLIHVGALTLAPHHLRTLLRRAVKDAHHTHLQVATVVVVALHILVRLSAEVSVVARILVEAQPSHTDRLQDEVDLVVEVVEVDAAEEDEECQHSTLHNL